MSFFDFNGGTNQWGVPMNIQQSFEGGGNAGGGGQDWAKYLQLAGNIVGQMSQNQSQQTPMVMPPQAPQIQTSGGQTGVGYRQPGFMRKGLLG